MHACNMRRRARKILLGIMLALLTGTVVSCGPSTPSRGLVSGSPSGPSASAVYALEGEAAVAQARAFVIGTWTYTKALEGGSNVWLKWVVKPDGTMDYYAANTTDDNWGTPILHHWSIMSGKYSNTGERYYALQIDDVTADHMKDPSVVNQPPMIRLFVVARTMRALFQPERAIIQPGILSDTLEYHMADEKITLERGDTFPFSK